MFSLSLESCEVKENEEAAKALLVINPQHILLK